ncbi:hypothetical protein MNBD_NITROSPIRAE01-28 [hydrothermal vent metagenome]|uniref:Cytochrome c-type biogenesis protein H TPR domain-containing protein n=1 Tax=hydrothermal vent metagenome TaxID=652676 RepID=A0A3B1CLD0_9ZZZZ
MFPFLITSLLVVVIGSLLFPFFRKTEITLILGQEALINEEQVNLQIERRTIAASLSELEVDFEQGRLTSSDYDQTRLGFEHRLLEVLDRLKILDKTAEAQQKSIQKESTSPSTGKNWISLILLALLIGGGATGGYEFVLSKLDSVSVSPGPAGGMVGDPQINPEEMVARLEGKLKENPNDLQGQMMIGRSYMAMGRWDDAERAWTKVLELDPRNYTAHYRLGEIMLSNPKTGTREEAEEALGHFDKALVSVPQDASILWARGIVLVQLGRTFEADEAWTEAYQYIPRNTESSEMVKQSLQDLRAGKMSPPVPSQ